MNADYYIKRFCLAFPAYFTRRQKKLTIFEKFLKGTIYDRLMPFYTEYDGSNKYVPLAKRRPSVIFNMPKIIINEIASLLFGENHFPTVKCLESNHEKTSEFLNSVSENSNLKLKMLTAVGIGSVGSVAIVVKYVDGNYVFEVLRTKYLKPQFSVRDEEELITLTDKRYFSGEDLAWNGYNISSDDFSRMFCLIREWTDASEFYYVPYPEEKDRDKDFIPAIDESRTIHHGLGFVPAVWIKNPSLTHTGIDGLCIFQDVLDIIIEIDYQLSQHGRGLKYNSDPTLVIKDPSSLENEQIIKGSGALMLGKDGDAKLLQIDGSATTAVLDYVSKLRQLALEVLRGDRANPDKLLSGHSGKALKMLNKPLVSLVSELRIAYGELGLKKLYVIVLKIAKISGLYDCDSLECDSHLTLDWPPFYPETEQDKSSIANTLQTLTENGIMSKETATSEIAPIYKIQDTNDELSKIEKEQKKLLEMQPQVKENINI